MSRKSAKPVFREAVGIFFDAQTLKAALLDLKTAGFQTHELGLLAGEFTVREQLGDLYQQVNQSPESPQTAHTAFVARTSSSELGHIFRDSLYLVGTAVGGGMVVATAGILGGAVGAAIATATVFGSVGAVLIAAIKETDAQYLEDQIEEGHMLLFVRTGNSEQESSAVRILAEHGAYKPRVLALKA